jgi:hypothetical protein
MTRILFLVGAETFSLCLHVQTGSGAHPFSYPIDEALFPGVKQLKSEADHTFPSSAEVKNQWSYTSTP